MVSIKRPPGHVVSNLFLHPVRSAGHVVHSDASWVRNIDALILMLRWDRYGIHTKCARTRYTKLMFLHLVGSAGHILYSGASRVRNIGTLFFMLGWARCCFYKMCDGTRYTKPVFLHLL
jgi:hypothetical protein